MDGTQNGTGHGTQAEKKETPFAVARLGDAKKIISQSAGELPAARKKLDRHPGDREKTEGVLTELRAKLHRLTEGLTVAALSLSELQRHGEAEKAAKYAEAARKFNPATPDYSKIKNALESFLSEISREDGHENGNAGHDDAAGTETSLREGRDMEPERHPTEGTTADSRAIGRLMNSVKMGYYPTCGENIGHIARGIECGEGPKINLLDPCCGCGVALSVLADRLREKGAECGTYGVELDTHRAGLAQDRLDRVGFGSFFASRISNEAFHAMLLNPPYLSVIREGGGNTRNEKKFLADSIRYLATGGLLIYIVPHYRLTGDISKIIGDNFGNVAIYRFTEKEFGKYRQVAIIGNRKKREADDATAERLSLAALSPERMPRVTEIPENSIALPEGNREVQIFKGAEFNVRELAEQLGKSKSLARMLHRSGLDAKAKTPLLPLSLGQIGLVGGSGLINGLVDCASPHVIKGRVVKEKRTRTEESTGATGRTSTATVTEITSNKLIFNILTPRGFLSLTEETGT